MSLDRINKRISELKEDYENILDLYLKNEIEGRIPPRAYLLGILNDLKSILEKPNESGSNLLEAIYYLQMIPIRNNRYEESDIPTELDQPAIRVKFNDLFEKSDLPPGLKSEKGERSQYIIEATMKEKYKLLKYLITENDKPMFDNESEDEPQEIQKSSKALKEDRELGIPVLDYESTAFLKERYSELRVSLEEKKKKDAKEKKGEKESSSPRFFKQETASLGNTRKPPPRPSTTPHSPKKKGDS